MTREHWLSVVTVLLLGQKFGGMPAHEKPVACAMCSKKKAFWMNLCPWCKESDLSRDQTDPQAEGGADTGSHGKKNPADWKR